MNQTFGRYEFKYRIPEYTMPGLQALFLRQGMRFDPSVTKHGGSQYTVTSLYFDSPSYSDYRDKAGGFLSRKKIRVRIYDSFLTERTREIWLEKKEKHDMRISKKRVLLSFENYKVLLRGSHTQLLRSLSAHAHGAEILWHLAGEQMKPQLITRYQRIPLIMPGPADFRITLDSAIEACFSRDLCYSPPMKRVQPGTAVLEVKFSTLLPVWFRDMLRQYNVQRESFSKYANAMEALRIYNPVPR